jgi:hypothetical protein
VDIDLHRLIVTQADPTRIRRVRVEPIGAQHPARPGDEPH